jgi:protein SCO1/2
MTRGFFLLLGLVLAAGIGALDLATEGFRVVTSEGARELAIERTRPPVPDVALFDQDGRAFSLSAYRGHTVLVDFIYTRCPTICAFAGDNFQRVLGELGRSAGDRSIDLLSVSFDAAHDDREALKLYADRFGALAPRWRIAAPADGRGLAELLKTFGVVVIPDGLGGFVHSSAVYIVSGDGRLERILDADAPDPISAASERVADR